MWAKGPASHGGGKTSVIAWLWARTVASPNPAFKGVRRELTAEDYAYSIKRLVDPENRSPSAYFVEGNRIVRHIANISY